MLWSVVFEEDSELTEITEYCFAECKALRSIRIPRAVRQLGMCAFFSCGGLMTVLWEGDSACEEIRDSCFKKAGLTSMDVPASVKKLTPSCFAECRRLKRVGFREGSLLELLPDYCFMSCGLTTIRIPRAVQALGRMCFCGCGRLERVAFEAGSALAQLGERCFGKCGMSREIELPAAAELVENFCFHNCLELELILLEPGSKLTKLGTELPESGSAPFIGIPAEKVTWKNGRLASNEMDSPIEQIVRRSGFRWCCIFTTLEKIEVPASVEVIDRLDFYACQWLLEISFALTSRLHEIKGFQNCVRLTKVRIPVSVLSISGFNGCVSLRHVTFEPGSSIICINGFSRCDSLEMITNPPLCWRLRGARVFISYAGAIMKGSLTKRMAG
jgi:hypothetical protein